MTASHDLAKQEDPTALALEAAFQAGREAAAEAILAHADKYFPADGNYEQQRARRHLLIAQRVALGPPSMDQVRDALVDLANLLQGTGVHATHDRTQVGECVVCSCGIRVQGQLAGPRVTEEARRG